MWPYRNLLVLLFVFASVKAFCQQSVTFPQDIEFHLNAHLLTGKKIISVKRDFHDPYLWVLAQNNEVYRINSLTQSIDNYTSQFAAYSNLQFVDIAGRSKDTVFIATSSPNLIQYKKGTLRLLGPADGIPGNLNSVGVSADGLFEASYIGHFLLIGTDAGFCHYDMDKNKSVNKIHNGTSKIFEATYKKQMYKDSSGSTSNNEQTDTVQYLPATHEEAAGGSSTGYFWEGSKQFGYNIHTGYYTSAAVYNLGDEVDYTNQFWGNAKGMFQNVDNLSYRSYEPYARYLNDVNVNKITSIYGQVAFGDYATGTNPGYIKENLLVGTDQGLYFSSSVYNPFYFPNGYTHDLRQFTLFHFDLLGNKAINDICVNTGSITPPICENGVWVACDDGLYYLVPDHSKYFKDLKFTEITFEGLPNDVTETKICAGTSITALLTPNMLTNIQWYKDGQELPGEISPNLVIKSSGDYYAELYDPCESSIHVESNHLKVKVISAPDFSFNYPDKIPQCDNTPVTLKTDDNPAYTYRWYTDGALNGNTTYSYTVTQTGKYKVEVSGCDGTWVPSKEVEVDLVDLPVPQVISDKPVYCAGDPAVLTINIPADPTYTINWYKDGILIAADKDLTKINTTTAGSYTVMLSSTIASCSQVSPPAQVTYISAPVFSFNYPDALSYCDGTPVTLKTDNNAAYQYRWYKDGVLTGDIKSSIAITQTGKYKVEVSACSGSWVTSKEVQVDLVKLPVPVIKADKPVYCEGQSATLSIGIPEDPSYSINWYKNDMLLPENNNQTSLVTTSAGDYSVAIVSNQTNTDGSICTQVSAKSSLVFNALPIATISKVVKTTLCDGQTVELKAVYTGGTVKWSTGETSDQITVTTPGIYTLTVTNSAGCFASANINIEFFPKPVLSIGDASICVYNHQTVTLTAPPGFAEYIWNGQPGSQTFPVTHPGTVTLLVTDANGCQATKEINVTDECPDVRIPNTFTPNGDQINDTWKITGLEYDPTALVSVFTRYGNKVFESRGYGTAWDGSFKGNRLPTGTYYYVITTKNGEQKYSGWVAIIY